MIPFVFLSFISNLKRRIYLQHLPGLNYILCSAELITFQPRNNTQWHRKFPAESRPVCIAVQTSFINLTKQIKTKPRPRRHVAVHGRVRPWQISCTKVKNDLEWITGWARAAWAALAAHHEARTQCSTQ